MIRSLNIARLIPSVVDPEGDRESHNLSLNFARAGV